MATGQWILLGYAVLMIVGGLMGSRAGSKVSLFAGVGSGVALLAALGVTHYAMRAGLWAGFALAVLLSLVFAGRVANTGKFMPSGMLLILSLAAATLLGYSAWAVAS